MSHVGGIVEKVDCCVDEGVAGPDPVGSLEAALSNGDLTAAAAAAAVAALSVLLHSGPGEGGMWSRSAFTPRVPLLLLRASRVQSQS